MLRVRMGLVLGLVLWPVAAMTDGDAPAGDVVTMPKPIDPKAARYLSSGSSGWEGWVLISRCIDVSGNGVDPVVLQSSGLKGFEREALKAVRESKYEPGTVNGTPVESCDQVLIQLVPTQSSPGLLIGGGVIVIEPPEIRKAWKHTNDLFDAGRLDEASLKLDEMKPWNSFYAMRRSILRAEIARRQGFNEIELRWLLNAVSSPLPIQPKQKAELLQQVYALQIAMKQFGQAVATYEALLKETDPQALPDAVRTSGEQLRAMVAGNAILSTAGSLTADAGDESATWWTQLVRREFAFAGVTGKPDRFELRCDSSRFRARFETGRQWKVPESWGKCRLVVFGESGATFTFLEYPKSEQPAPG